MARTMMAAAILLIAAFQAYWIDRLYKEERQGLQKETSGIFRDVIYNLQVERFKADTLFNRRIDKPNLFVYNAVNAIRRKVSDFKKIQPDSRFRVDSSGNVMVVMAGGKGPDSLGHKQHFSFRTNDMPDRQRVEQHAELWRPYRTAATWYLWQALELAQDEL